MTEDVENRSEESPFVLDLQGVHELETADELAKRLMELEESIPVIEPKESHIIALWNSYAQLDEIVRRWADAHPDADTAALHSAYHGFLNSLFESIIATEFEIESVAGLSIMTAMIAQGHHFEHVTREMYQETLEWLSYATTRLTYKLSGLEYPEPSEREQLIPRTLH